MKNLVVLKAKGCIFQSDPDGKGFVIIGQPFNKKDLQAAFAGANLDETTKRALGLSPTQQRGVFCATSVTPDQKGGDYVYMTALGSLPQELVDSVDMPAAKEACTKLHMQKMMNVLGKASVVIGFKDPSDLTKSCLTAFSDPDRPQHRHALQMDSNGKISLSETGKMAEGCFTEQEISDNLKDSVEGQAGVIKALAEEAFLKKGKVQEWP